MNKQWELKKIGEVCKVVAGQSPEGKYYNQIGKGLPFYQGKKEFTEKYIGEPTTWTTHVTKEADPDDILISVRAPVGPVNISTTKICIGRGLAAIRASKLINRDYLFYFLVNHEAEIIGNTGAVFNSINKSQIEDISIPLPPLPEQQRIVSILDIALTAIATAKEKEERNLRNSRALYENYLQSIFINRGDEWRIKLLGNLAIFRNGINYTKNSQGECIKIVGVKDFQDNYWTPLEGLDIVRIDGNLAEHDVLKKGDILAVRSNGNIELIGRCILAGDIPEKISHSGFTIRIRLSSSEVLPEYLCYFMKSRSSRKRLIDNGTGTNIKSLNQTTLSTLEVSYPSISQQRILIKNIEALYDETKRLESIYQKKLADLEELRRSILHKTFNGDYSGAN